MNGATHIFFLLFWATQRDYFRPFQRLPGERTGASIGHAFGLNALVLQ